jgi:hypothetical protein
MTEPVKTTRERFCCWCGESLGFPDYYERSDTCGEPECDRQARSMEREAEEERADRAREDGYERY